MSKVLAIYNDWAFYEIVLPAISNTEYFFLLDSDLFHLGKDEIIYLECIHGEWFFQKDKEELKVEAVGGDWSDTKAISEHKRYNLTTKNDEVLTILVENKPSPLNVYSKHILEPNRSITIGFDPDNVIQYRYPHGNKEKNFVSHHHCSIYYDGVCAFLEDTSSNGTYINNVRVNGRKKLNFGDSIRIFRLNIIYLGKLIAVNTPADAVFNLTAAEPGQIQLLSEKGSDSGSSQKTMYFRAPRIVPKINIENVSIDAPPNPRELPKVPLLMQIGPAMTMAVPMLLGSGMTVAASRMSGMTNSALMMTGVVTALASASIGTFWAVMNMRFNKKTIREGEERRFRKYGQYLIDKQNYIEKLYEADSNAYRQKYLSSEVIADFDAASEKLWDRNFNHRDMLSYRIGMGDMPFPVAIEVPKSKFSMIDDSLAEKPQMIKERFSVMHNVPVCLDIKDRGLIGVIGKGGGWAQIIKNMVIQIAANNSYTDVKIVFAYDATKISNAKSWEFVKWLPHVWSEDKKLRFYAANKNEANQVFFSLGQTMGIRSEEDKSLYRPHYVLFILNTDLMDGELIAKYIGENSSRIGLSTVIAAERYEELPNNCEFIVENNPNFSGVYSTIDENIERIPVNFDFIRDEKLSVFSKRLANIEVDEVENGGEIPSSVSFFEMYGISRPEDLNAAERWRRSKITETMKALIGLKNGKTPCYLDIHERYHGPHGLVAGTTGSGKSETLQTYMLSLAINYSPDDVGFFIIDYKGGGMANLFKGLPHMIGAISNLSGNQVKRAMVSIKSENKRRQRVFSEYGVNNINSYTQLYKNGDAKEPIPHMLIIIDEFAELKREEPDFMRELISVAQVGRSLGVHLILATQKPSGTVDENIWSNSKFKLCLRVQDRQDSMDMLHRPDAAYLTQAGRGYLQVGNDEIFELFQSGYSGAVYDESLGDKKLVVAQMLDNIGKVDLVGNHFKIQHQEKVQRDWITALASAVQKALEARKGSSTAEGEPWLNEAFLSDVYVNIAGAGYDFKSGPYNDIRLRDFIKLYLGMEIKSGDNVVQMIQDAARERGVKLPELKNKTQLEAVNEYLAHVAAANGYTHSIQLWMPLLPAHLLLTQIDGYHEFELQEERNTKQWTLSAIIGKGDDPENQSQMPIFIDFANNGHHAVCGTVSTGKSTFLQTAVYSLINKYSSDELNLYLIDFSAKLLNVFAESRHVGGIMTDAEEDREKISKFFTLLSRMMAERKALLSSTNYRDYVEHSGKKLPAIVIVIDNYAGFREKTDEQYEDMIRRIGKEGISYGIYLLVTAGGFGASEIPSRLADCFRTTICLEMSDIYQYSDVMRVVKSPIYPEPNTKGRGLVYYGEKIIEFQTALAGDGESVFDRNNQIQEKVQKINSLNTGKAAKCIPVIPSKPVWEEYIKQEDYAELTASKDLVPNGYNAVTAAYSALRLTSLLTYAVSGTKKSGKSTYMKILIRAFADKSSQIAVIEMGSSEFAQIAQETGCEYITDGQGIYNFAKNTLLPQAGERAKKKAQCLAKHLEDAEFFDAMLEYRRICVFIPNMTGFLAELYNRDSQAYNAVSVYETLVGDKGYHYNFYFFAEVQDSDISDVLGYRFMQRFKENGTGIRFGGKYLNQKLFSYANIPYKIQNSPLKPGIGVVPTEDESAVQEQIVVPNYKG